MTNLEFTAWVGLESLGAGLLGALTGLGGGVVLVPLMVLGFHVDLRYAVGASLVSVIATSSGAAASYVREGYSNVRVGMFLEMATTLGALAGASLAAVVPASAVAVVFGLVLLATVYPAGQPRDPPADLPPDPLAGRLRLDLAYPTEHGPRPYRVRRVPLGFVLMAFAGALSGLLGIGSGALKVLAMDRAMGIPFKVSTTTSNFMIGVTAATSAGIYLRRGWLDPWLTFPVVLGALTGSVIGARLLPRIRGRSLRLVFGVVIAALAAEMIYQGLTGRL